MAARGSQRDQLRRMSLLVPYVVNHPGVSVETLAEEFGTTPAQITKDLSALMYCGLPGQGMGETVEVVHRSGGVWITEHVGIERPLQLTSEEATALVMALRALADNPGQVDYESVMSALAKIESVAGSRVGPSEIAVTTTPAPAVAATLTDAIASRRAVAIDYFVPRRNEITHRIVEPVQVFRVDGHDYLEAWCRTAEDTRTFRIDRIDTATVLDEPVVDRTPDPRDLADGVYVPDQSALDVVIHVTSRGRWVSEHYQISSLTDLPDGTSQVRMFVSDEETLDGIVTALGPEGLASTDHPLVRAAAERVARRSAAALRRYQ